MAGTGATDARSAAVPRRLPGCRMRRRRRDVPRDRDALFRPCARVGRSAGARMTKRIGVALVVLWAMASVLAPVLAPHGIDERFGDYPNAPPTRPHIIDDAGSWHAPFVYRSTLVNRLEQIYQEDRAVRVPIAWFAGGRVMTSSAPRSPLLLLGADSYGRDV